MTQISNHLPIEVLVEVIAAHDSQTLDGSPQTRIEGRLLRSIELAKAAKLYGLRLHLDRQDLVWLNAARGLNHYSSASHQSVGGVLVSRARPEFTSHITGRSSHALERRFPIVADPSLTPGFVRHVPSDEEKRDLLERFRQQVALDALDQPIGGAEH